MRPGFMEYIFRLLPCGYSSAWIFSRGLGPTMLISPTSTFTSCGISLIFVFLRSFPKRLGLGSVNVVISPSLSEPLGMVVNFMSLKRFLFCPTLSCKKKMSSPVSFIKIETITNTGERMVIAKLDSIISIRRFKKPLWFKLEKPLDFTNGNTSISKIKAGVDGLIRSIVRLWQTIGLRSHNVCSHIA